MKDVQCHELFAGIALKNSAFLFLSHIVYIKIIFLNGSKKIVHVYSIPSPIRGSPFAASHTRGFCYQSFF